MTNKNTETAVAETSQELTVYTGSDQFPVLAISPTQLQEELDDVLGGEPLTPGQLDTIGVPLGGGKEWQLPAVGADEAPSAPTFEGIILASHFFRSYWESAYSGEASNPDCSSVDGKLAVVDGRFGYGSQANPTGQCAKCPMSQWGSGNNGKGQACKLKAAIYVLLPGLRFPVKLVLPPTSLGIKDPTGFRAYTRALANRGKHPTSVVTRFGLRQEPFGTGKNASSYSIATFSMADDITMSDEEKARARAYAEALRPSLIPVSQHNEVEGSVEDSDTAKAPAAF